MKKIFLGHVNGGRIKLNNVEHFNRAVGQLEGKEIQLSIGRRYDDRSSNQNRYYWGVVVKILSDSFGYYDEEMHEALKWKFLRKTGGPIPTVLSTTRLSTLEFEDYCSKIREWASSEHDIKIPLPGEIELDY